MQPLSQKEMDELSRLFTLFVLQKSIDSPWIAGAKEFLEANYKDNDFYIISGTPQKELELLIEKRNMEKYFKGIYGTPPEKPKTMKEIISRNYYQPSKTLYIGDTLGDLGDAQLAGIKFLGLTTKSIFPEEIKTIKDFTKGLNGI
jgi:HAD superfamily hydrolase (TIGR01549 family)